MVLLGRRRHPYIVFSFTFWYGFIFVTMFIYIYTTNWWKNSRNKEGYHSMLTNWGEHSATSRNKEGYHSMLNNPGEHSVASYFNDTQDTSPPVWITSWAEASVWRRKERSSLNCPHWLLRIVFCSLTHKWWLAKVNSHFGVGTSHLGFLYIENYIRVY